ncbi:MAG: ribose-phosphate pyrophosphokinase [Elusimicrobia bacterium]|nr:ribose-phosphate pyrophosphokinase [Elusimicrobiota bacterium]
MGEICVISGNANRDLAEKIARCLDIPLADVLCGRFSEGEIRVQIISNVRGKDVFIVQPTCSPTNDNLMELLVLIDAAKRASAARITAVLPFYGYARQDRKDQPRVPITAKLVANLMTAAGVDRVLAMDLHASQIQGFFDIPVDHLYAINTLCEYFENMGMKNLVVVSPDIGGIRMARAYAKRLGAGLAIIDKRRMSPEETEVMNILGKVKGKTAILVDDMIATGGSMMEAIKAIKEMGVEKVYAAVSHGVLSGNAIEKIQANKDLEEIVITDSIPLPKSKKISRIKQLTVAPLLAEAIKRIHNEQSISCLFDVNR